MQWHSEAADLEWEKALTWICHGESRESVTSGCRGGQKHKQVGNIIREINIGKVYKGLLNMTKSGSGWTSDSWAVGGCTGEACLQTCLVFPFSWVFVAGCCWRLGFGADEPWFDLAELLSVLSQRESPPECDSEQECDAALPSLPCPAWTAGQCRDIIVYLSTCIRHLKFLGLNVPFSDYNLQKAIASLVSKPHCF